MAIQEGWCSGTLGCADLCEESVVYTGIEDHSYFTSEELSRIAQELLFFDEGDNPNFGFKCDCTAADEGRKCDADYDGRFEGACDGGECNDVICTPGTQQCNAEVSYQRREVCNDVGTGWGVLDDCDVGFYCREEGRITECERQKCGPKELICYPDFLRWVGRYYPDEMQEVEADTRENPARRNYPFVCNERGSEYDDIEVACSPCSSTVTVVEVGEEWRCGECRQSDWDNHRRCLKDGVRGACRERGSGTRRTYVCE